MEKQYYRTFYVHIIRTKGEKFNVGEKAKGKKIKLGKKQSHPNSCITLLQNQNFNKNKCLRSSHWCLIRTLHNYPYDLYFLQNSGPSCIDASSNSRTTGRQTGSSLNRLSSVNQSTPSIHRTMWYGCSSRPSERACQRFTTVILFWGILPKCAV